MKEKTLLSLLLQEPSNIELIASFLKPQDFKDETIKQAYEDILEANKHNKITTEAAETIAETYQLSLKKTSDKPFQLADNIKRNSLTEQCKQEIIKATEELNKAPSYLTHEHIEKIKHIASQCPSIPTKKESLVEKTKRVIFEEKTTHGLTTGFKELDLLVKLTKGELFIIAARPSCGKTSLALSMLANISKEKITQLFISVEIPDYMALIKVLSMEKNIAVSDIMSTGATYWEEEILQYLEQEYQTKHITIENDDGTLQSVIRLIHEYPARVVYIDYLQLMSIVDCDKHRNQEIGLITRALKKIAIQLGITIVLLSQVSRAAEERIFNPAPMLSDLRDSGAIEQDADIVIFLAREKTKDKEQTNVFEVTVAKNRNGETGNKKLLFNSKTTKFEQFITEDF